MPYDPKAIANYFLELAKSRDQTLDPMKVQKLVYYAHGWYLAIKNAPLIDEQVEAWTFGPVIRSLYYTFKRFGAQPISDPAVKHELWEGDTDDVRFREVVPSIDEESEDFKFVKPLLDKVWDVYGKYSAIQLSNMTHEAGSPWEQTVRKCEEENGGLLLKDTDIPSKIIREYFLGLARS